MTAHSVTASVRDAAVRLRERLREKTSGGGRRLLAGSLFLLLSALPAGAATVTNTNDSGAGSLRQAIADAASGETITFDLATCPCTITLTSGELVINKDLTIQGPGAKLLTISGNHTSRVFNIDTIFPFSDYDVTLSDMTVADGSPQDFPVGGGIYKQGLGVLNVLNCAVTNNRAEISGSGVAGQGGGIAFTGDMNVVNSSITANNASSLDSTGRGGGIADLSYGALTVTNSTIVGNTAVGISGTPNGRGGGISSLFGYVAIRNSTIVGNASNDFGGGIYGSGSLRNSIVAGNLAAGSPNDLSGSVINAFVGSSHAIVGTGGAGIINGQSGNIVGVNVDDVVETTLADNGGPTPTLKLRPNSPAIDAGSTALALDLAGQPLTTDQRGVGFTRVDGASVDIGAYERTVTKPVVTPVVTGTLGNNGWYTSNVVVSWTSVSPSVPTTTGCDPSSVTLDTASAAFTCSASTEAGTTMQSVTVKRDATAPLLTVTIAPSPVLLNSTATATPAASDAISGVGSATCDAVLTTSVGPHTVTCTATDNAGNVTTVNAPYTVIVSYGTSGFLTPVVNPPSINTANAGRAYPLKWQLRDASGAFVTTLAVIQSVTYQTASCTTFAPTSGPVAAQPALGGGLRYEPSTNRFQFDWKTPPTAGCYVATVTLAGGQTLPANFSLR